ncbi:MAG: hypothetical protein AAF490_29460 [Chloroflexota bacterium]
MKKYICLATMVFLLLGCTNKVDEGPEVIAELAAKIPADLESNRGNRNCELFDAAIEGDQIVINVWNNAAQGHDCPDDWLATVDTHSYFVDGPRWQPVDHIISVDDNLNLILDGASMLEGDPVIREIPEGSGITMLLAATVELGPARRIANSFDIELDDSGDVPLELQQAIFDQLYNDASYEITEVDRVFNTFWVYKAGNPVYVMSDGECEYAMKYFTSSENQSLTNEEIIFDLNSLFEEMPQGFRYEVRQFSEDVYVLNLDGLQHVLTDEFGNSYDRLWCGDSEASYTILN